jgi:hypothetical protein
MSLIGCLLSLSFSRFWVRTSGIVFRKKLFFEIAPLLSLLQIMRKGDYSFWESNLFPSIEKGSHTRFNGGPQRDTKECCCYLLYSS